jgi:hypothetical protein
MSVNTNSSMNFIKEISPIYVLVYLIITVFPQNPL